MQPQQDKQATVLLDAQDQLEAPQKPNCNCHSKVYVFGATKYPYFIPIVFFVIFCNYIDVSGVNLALPQIQQEFNISPSVSQWILTSYNLAMASMSIPLAKFAESIGQVYAMYIFLACLAICDFSIYFVDNFYFLCAVHFLNGSCFAGATSARMALIRKLAPPPKAQAYMMYTGTVIMIIIAIVPLTASFIIKYDWRILFLCAGSSAILSILVLIPYTNPKVEKKHGEKVDVLGIISLFIAAASLDLSFTFLSMLNYMWFGILLGIAIVGFICFFYVENKVKNPVFPLYLLKNPVAEYATATFITQITLSGMGWIVPQYVSNWGKAMTIAGGFTSMGSIVVIVITIFLPMLVKRVVNKYILMPAYLLVACLFVLCGLITPVFWGEMGSYLAESIIYAIPNFLIYTIILVSVPLKFTSQISAIPNTCRTFGSSITYSLTSLILESCKNAFIKRGVPTQTAFSYGMSIVWAIYLVLNLGVMVLLWARTGMTSNEIGKKWFKPEKVRELKVLQEANAEEAKALLKKQEEKKAKAVPNYSAEQAQGPKANELNQGQKLEVVDQAAQSGEQPK